MNAVIRRFGSKSICVIAVLAMLPLMPRDLSAEPTSEQISFFEKRVRPLLLENCTHCHGAEQQEGGLRLDSRNALLKGGDRGPAVIPEDAKNSLLVHAVRHSEDLEMPPDEEPLSEQHVADLARWINDGAAWPKDEQRIGAGTPIDRIAEIRGSHWSLQPVERPLPPESKESQWAKNDIDRFVLARLEKANLLPSATATRRDLVRRVYFDLIGLPPTPQEVDAFVNDQSEDSYRQLIEQLLNRPEYGQHWGRHWLDVVRYADTAGDASDYPVPEAYKYRNYVIDSFNRDTPYNEFIEQQIAGDLLPYENDDDRWEQTIATGYLAVSRRIGVDPLGLRHITLEDTIDNLGKTFLGLSVGCARCHNHKFDPISAADYYALYGIFDSSVFPHAGAEHAPYRRDFVYRLDKQKVDELLKPYRERLAVWNHKERAKFKEYQDLQEMRTDPNRTRLTVFKELEEIRRQRIPYAEAFPSLEIAYAIVDGNPHDVEVQKAGDPDKRGELVRRGFLEVLGGQKLPDGHAGSGRRELAGWIADPENPLTARVMVNRIWHYHFGKGLVKSTSDFGLRGKSPTHPELLDYLAAYFVDHGWSVKQMHRLIMNSETYRLAAKDVAESSAVDPENDLLWRANRRRMSAEQIRDSLLMFGGDLDVTPAARHPFPHHLTYYYRQHEPFVGDYPTNKRTVYMMQQRIQKNPFLDLFDGPDGNIQFAERRATTTTLQAMYFMNSEFIHERSRDIAERLLDVTEDDDGRVRWAYQVLFGRPPSDRELERASRFLVQFRAQVENSDQNQDLAVWSAYLRSMISSNEFLFIE